MLPALYIMCGLPYSGKTVLAKKLSKKYGWKLVEIDGIKARHGFAGIWQDMKMKDWDEIFSESFEVVRNELGAGRSIIYDSANLTRESRDRLKNIAKESSAEARLIFLDIPTEEAISRWRENEKAKFRHHLPEWALKAAIKTYQPPTTDEMPVSLDLP